MEHPIEGLMETAMTNIKAMVDVNTIVGEPVRVPDGTIIIPISTVSFGFAAGGSEFAQKSGTPTESTPMFGGGCGGGANVKPVAFLVVGNGTIRMMSIGGEMSPLEKVIDLIPEMVDKVNGALSDMSQKRAEKKEKKQQDKRNKNSENDPEIDVYE
jgi:sporulation protein YtfJ